LIEKFNTRFPLTLKDSHDAHRTPLLEDKLDPVFTIKKSAIKKFDFPTQERRLSI
jgi:hypothetical protein